jgi:NAD(P)-dependent dehydrogenase (short-subunit alcohol dehydrogenase family)
VRSIFEPKSGRRSRLTCSHQRDASLSVDPCYQGRLEKLNGKIAVVTGASRGIGRAIAVRLAREGAKTVLCARDTQALDGAVREITEFGGQAASLSLDLRVPEASRRLAEFAQHTFGQIDIVVNNAGATKRGEFVDLTEDDWADGYALKFFGAVRLTRSAWPHLKATSGSLINISGIGGRTPEAQFTIGGSVNAALIAFTKAMAAAGIRDGVQVNVINPGTIRTDRFQKRLVAYAAERGIDTTLAEREFVREHQTTRIGEPEDIAALVAFVASPEGRFLHGAMVDMDGGATKTL